MIEFLKELGQAAIISLLIGGPFFYYFLFMMRP
jgi:hypothetical protein